MSLVARSIDDRPSGEREAVGAVLSSESTQNSMQRPTRPLAAELFSHGRQLQDSACPVRLSEQSAR